MPSGSRRTRQIANATSADGDDGEQDEPDEQLLGRSEAGERPRPVDGGDDARDADEMIRVGRHRQMARGAQVEHRVDDHAAERR